MLKLQCFGHLMQRANSLEKTLMLGKIEGWRRRGRQMMRWLDGITNLMDMSLSKLWNWWWTEKPGVLQSMGSQRVGHNWVTELSQLIIKDIIKDTDEQPDTEVCRRKSWRVLSVATSVPCGYRAQHLLECCAHQPGSSNLDIQDFIELKMQHRLFAFPRSMGGAEIS